MSLIDCIHRCNNLPAGSISGWAVPFMVDNHLVGYIRRDLAPLIVKHGQPLLEWTENDGDDGAIRLTPSLQTEQERSRAIADRLNRWRSESLFPCLAKWRGELYPIYRPKQSRTASDASPLLFTMERCAVGLFGLRRFGCHLNGYYVDEDGGGVRMWIAERSKTKQTWPGYLDNMVGGGLPAGISPKANMIKECQEEAGLSPTISSQCHATGFVSYAMDDVNRGLILETDYTFDLQLPLDFHPEPVDGEVAAFQLLHMDEVLDLVKRQKFTPEAALVIVDFAVRHGIVHAENDSNYLELISGLRSHLLRLPGP